MYEPAWLIPNSPILRAVFKGPNRSNRGTVSPIAQVARQKNEKGTDYWFLSYPSQTILREIKTMKRNHAVILALLFALLPVLSACDSALVSDNGPNIDGKWIVTQDGVRTILDLRGNSNVTGTYSIVGGLRGDVTGDFDSPNVRLFVNFSGGGSKRLVGSVNIIGTVLKVVDEDGERIRFDRTFR